MRRLFLLIFSLLLFVFARPAKALPFNVRPSVDKNVIESVDISPTPSATTVVNPSKLKNTVRLGNKEQIGAMLEGAKLQACKSREEAIRTRQRSLVRLGSERIKIMDNWVRRLTNFYEENGLKIENYNDLLSSIDTARNNLVQSLDEASSLTENFSCEADDPKGLYSQFRRKMQETKRYMFEYRKAIKNLLVAIRRVAVGIKPTATPPTEE